MASLRCFHTCVLSLTSMMPTPGRTSPNRLTAVFLSIHLSYTPLLQTENTRDMLSFRTRVKRSPTGQLIACQHILGICHCSRSVSTGRVSRWQFLLKALYHAPCILVSNGRLPVHLFRFLTGVPNSLSHCLVTSSCIDGSA